MAGSTPRETVVEIDGLWFRVQKLRGRRALRGSRALQITLGIGGYNMVKQPKFWAASDNQRLTALVSVRSLTAAKYNEIEEAFEELLVFSDGQGVSYRDQPPDPDRPGVGWVPITGMSTLDRFDSLDHDTWEALHWEMIKLVYRPTTAVTGTDPGTRQGGTTSMQGSDQRGAAAKPQNGPPSPAETPLGFSGG